MECLLKEKNKEGIVFIDKTEIDNETIKQIRSMIKHEAVENARIMPDCHKGNGCCIGFTSKLVDKIVPNFVGGDIGCGIVSYPIELDKPIKPKQFYKHLKEYIPTGNYLGGKNSKYYYTEIEKIQEYMERIYELSENEANSFIQYYKDKFGLDLKEFKPVYNVSWFEELCKKIKIEEDLVLKQLGTLGGGNHFIEVNKSCKNEKEYLTVHSGSRALGQAVCKYHQDIITNGRNLDWDGFDNKVKKFSRECKEKKKIKEYKDKLRNEMMGKRHEDYLVDEEAFRYYFDMIFCQKYALVNREIMITKSIKYYNLEFDSSKKIESIHNYIDFSDFVLRKGAIRAKKDQLCLLALNMRDGILLCRGKGNERWNESSAHGSGRMITRQKAIKNKVAIVKRLEKEMTENDIYTSGIYTAFIDEAPECYKDSELIKELIEPSVEIIEQLKPILNIKGLL